MISIEDKRFRSNSGIDLPRDRPGLRRRHPAPGSRPGRLNDRAAVRQDALAAQAHRTVFEKIREAALAFHLAHHWSKEKIITEYLNAIYFGNGAYGIEAAAQTYFGHEPEHEGCGTPRQRLCVEELKPWEAALLAGIIQSPTDYNPVTDPTAALERRNVVLAQMLEQHYISRAVYAESLRHPVPAAKQITAPEQPLIDGIDTGYRRLGRPAGDPALPRRPGLRRGPAHQDHARPRTAARRRSSRRRLPAGPEGPSAALVAIENSTGKIRAMVGGRDYNQTPFNLATEAERQPGSSFKAFDLAAALEDGISPESVWTSKPKIFRVGPTRTNCSWYTTTKTPTPARAR